MDHLPQLLLAWSIQVVGVVSPGPSVMLILGVAVSQGRAPSLLVALGVACGSATLAVATVLGLAALMAEVAWAMTAVRWIGGAYLVWLGVKAFRSAARSSELTLKAAPKTSAWRTAFGGYTLQVTNPKAVMFWLAIAGVGGVGAAPASVVAVFIAGSFLISFIGHGGYAWLLSSGPTRALYTRFRRWIDAALGSVFVLSGLRLALSRG